MSTSTDQTKNHLGNRIKWAQDNQFTAEQNQEYAQRDFIRTVEKVAEAVSAVSTARAELREFEASLCPACNCNKEDHGDAKDYADLEGEDPRTGWVCYDCGRREECPQ